MKPSHVECCLNWKTLTPSTPNSMPTVSGWSSTPGQLVLKSLQILLPYRSAGVGEACLPCLRSAVQAGLPKKLVSA